MSSRRAREARYRHVLAWAGGGWVDDTPVESVPQPKVRKAEFGKAQAPGTGRGLVLGRFLPPHRGHQYLVDFARADSNKLVVVVRSRADDPISGAQRRSWLAGMFPDVQVHDLELDKPDPAKLKELVGKVDRYYSSEPDGEATAQAIGAWHVPVDPGRTAVPVSGTAIRAEPMKHWEYLMPCARPHFARRVCLIGPAGSGKTTLAGRLAERFGTVWAPEYARVLRAALGRDLKPGDVQLVARGQRATEDALVRQANRVLIQDTDLISWEAWSESLFGSCPEWIRKQARTRFPHLYLLCGYEQAYTGDPRHASVVDRMQFFGKCRLKLELEGRKVVALTGSWDLRFETAARAVEALLKP